MAWKGRSSFSPYCDVYKCNGFSSKKTCRACCLAILLNYYIIIQLIILSPKWAKCHQISILEQFHNITVENLTNFKLLNVWLCIRIMSLLTETMDEVFYIEKLRWYYRFQCWLSLTSHYLAISNVHLKCQ